MTPWKSEVLKKSNGAYMTCRGYNGRCVTAWLADALNMFSDQRTDLASGRVVGSWVAAAVQSGELPDWPWDGHLPATLEALC